MASEQLLRTIDHELRWREMELAISKIHLHRSMLDQSAFAFSYRSFIVLTYAHFEAFTKRVIAQALQDISDSGVVWSHCKRSIQANLFARRLRSKLSSLSNEELIERGSSTVCLIDELPPPDVSEVLECANLDVANSNWILECIGMDPARYRESRRDIGRLATIRHDCAHGEALTFDQTKTERELIEELFSLQRRIILLMHQLAVDIIDHMVLCNYRQDDLTTAAL
jgi:hypothetical protein